MKCRRVSGSCWWFALAAITMTGCGSKNGASGTATTAGTSSSKSAAGPSDAVTLHLHQVMDTEGTGKLACTYLIPPDWTAKDDLKWIPNNFMTPAILFCTITSPDGSQQLESLSATSIIYSHGPMGDSGQKPPTSVCSFLLDGWRKERPGVPFAVVSQKDVPQSKSIFDGGPMAANTFSRIGTLNLKFKKDGKTFAAKLTAQIDGYRTAAMPTAIGGDLYEGGWVIMNAYTAVAPESSFDDSMKLYGIILSSGRIDPHFYNTVVQAQKIIQANFYAQQRQIMETSRIIAQTGNEISDMIMSSYHDRESVQDKAVQGFDDYIRGVDRFKDGDSEVPLPNNYGYAWSNGNGDYIVSEKADYNPSQDHSGSWTQLEKAGH